MTKVNFDDLEARTKPRDKAWENWSKFEKPGDSYSGFIRDVFFKKGSTDFPDQRVLTLEQEDGEFVNVGIKHIDFVLEKTNSLRLNDPVKVVFAKELAPQVRGHNPTKQFEFFGTNLPENENESTVLDLEIADRKANEGTQEQPSNDDAPAASGDTPEATPEEADKADDGEELPFEGDGQSEKAEDTSSDESESDDKKSDK